MYYKGILVGKVLRTHEDLLAHSYPHQVERPLLSAVPESVEHTEETVVELYSPVADIDPLPVQYSEEIIDTEETEDTSVKDEQKSSKSKKNKKSGK